MRKIVLILIIVLLAYSLTVFATEGDIIKISMNKEVKNTASNIVFTLPDPTTNDFILYAVELQVFERQEGKTQWTAFKDGNNEESKRQMIQNPTSLKFAVSFGNIQHFQDRSKYKIGYRYYMQSTSDLSKIIIAGEDIKSGWRLVGEQSGIVATEAGMMFYRNATPTISVDSISFQAGTITGTKMLNYSPGEITDVWLPSNALQNGITISYAADDFDSEDIPSVSYRLVNTDDESIIQSGALDDSGKIISATDANMVRLVLVVTDSWGAFSESEDITLKIDKEMPQVVDEFNDMGRALRGRNLYSKFTIKDDPGKELSTGNVYYTIRSDEQVLYKNIKFNNNTSGQYTVNLTNMVDGRYEIELTILDKAYNKTIHILEQTLDNTPPVVTFLTPTQNPEATLYSTWLNESKKILFSATDSVAGVNSCTYYLDYSWKGSTTLATPKNEYTFFTNIPIDKTGKLYYYFYVYDNACTINQDANIADTSSSGNYAFATRYIWLDKTPPNVTIHSDENKWYTSPITVYADFYDYPSSISSADNSGVQFKYYTVTRNDKPNDNWQIYTNGVTFDTGGVFYLHCKAVDYARNETVVSRKIMINSPVKMIGEIIPTDEYRHTIYNHSDGLYIIKNTAYNTKYHFTTQELDIQDTLCTNVSLVNQDNETMHSIVEANTVPNGAVLRNVTFSLPYITADGAPLPDGIYTMYISVSEIKNDGTIIDSIQNYPACEVMIKRSSPPEPIINVADNKVSIMYPEEYLANSLNRVDIKSLYKRQHKSVYGTGGVAGVYEDYIYPIDTADMTITALYTDPAGNISTTSKRVFKSEYDDRTKDISTDGNTVTVEESRPANVYYIGTRREKHKGIDESIFEFIN